MRGHVRNVDTKTTADGFKSTKIIILTDDRVAGELEEIPGDCLVRVTITADPNA